MKTFLFEVTDSDGYDSTQEIRAKDQRTARRIAVDYHLRDCHPYAVNDPEAGPFVSIACVSE